MLVLTDDPTDATTARTTGLAVIALFAVGLRNPKIITTSCAAIIAAQVVASGEDIAEAITEVETYIEERVGYLKNIQRTKIPS